MSLLISTGIVNDLNFFRNLAIRLHDRIFVALFILVILLSANAQAQTSATLHSFSTLSDTADYPPYGTNSDGYWPVDGLVLSGNTLYGTAQYGGYSGSGTVFAVNTDGSGFKTLHSFINSQDGASPAAGLTLSGNILYGTAAFGGRSGSGTIFAINVNGSGFTNLHSFAARSGPYPSPNSDGARPSAGLVLSGNVLYGTAWFGGKSGNGTIFKIKTNGKGFKNLYNFSANSNGNSTNSDGAEPVAGLILSGNTLFGTARNGGIFGHGTTFAINTDGTHFRNLHSFSDTDGASPIAGLTLLGNRLYGTTFLGGSSGNGVVFAVKTDGAGFTDLHAFAMTSGPGGGYGTNFDGDFPSGSLVLLGNNLYGTASFGGSSGNGTVFAVNINGTEFTNLHSFTALTDAYPYGNSDGDGPTCGLVLSSSALYGTTAFGGASGKGSVFSLSFKPQLKIIPSGGNVIFAWPTNVAGFDYSKYTLQSTTNLNSGSAWRSTRSPKPAIVNGQNVITNPITGTQMFFRLSQ